MVRLCKPLQVVRRLARPVLGGRHVLEDRSLQKDGSVPTAVSRAPARLDELQEFALPCSMLLLWVVPWRSPAGGADQACTFPLEDLVLELRLGDAVRLLRLGVDRRAPQGLQGESMKRFRVRRGQRGDAHMSSIVLEVHLFA